jgi:hypothetical protein
VYNNYFESKIVLIIPIWNTDINVRILLYGILKINSMNEKKINQFISHQLVKAREELGYTQIKVQQDKVINQSNLSKIENGVKNISAAKLFVLANYYKKPIEYFFENGK